MLIKIEDYAKHGLDASAEPSLAAIEAKIRSCTGNSFQVRTARVEAQSVGGALYGASRYWRVGDTVHVSIPESNAGIYVVKAIEDGKTTFDRELFDEPFNRATLVRYPSDVVGGAIGIYEYEKAMPKAKVAVASESLSRHSVTYRQVSAEDMFAGYPAEVTAFMKPYMRARF